MLGGSGAVVMAGITAISSSSPSPLPLLSSSSSSSSSPNFYTSCSCSYYSPATHQTCHPLRHNLKPRRIANPRISVVCYGKFNGGGSEPSAEGGEGSDEIEETFYNGDEDDEIEEEDEEEEETESSLDLLFRFIQSMFKKLSKRAKKATRSILPPAISPQLVSFAVDGVLILTLLSIVKALLQVVCTLGGTVFIAILMLRVIWAIASHFQPGGNNFNQSGNGYGTTQPST